MRLDFKKLEIIKEIRKNIDDQTKKEWQSLKWETKHAKIIKS